MRYGGQVQVGGRQIDVEVTAVDRLVNWLSPAAGAKRLQARARMTMLGAYTSADKSRRANQRGRVPEQSADSAILPDLITLREDSQHMLRNNPIAVGAVKTNITKVIGRGLYPRPQVDRKLLGLDDATADAWEDAALREYLLATETKDFDVERQYPFSLLQAMSFYKVLEDGDVFANLPRLSRPGSPYSIKLQLIEAARVCNPQMVADSDTIAGGIQRDDNGAPAIAHVCNRHPGNRRFIPAMQKDGWTWSPLKLWADSGWPLCLHLLDKTRPGQTRGVPYLAPVIELIKQLGRYTDAEVMAAVVSGMVTGFVYNETASPLLNPAPNPDNPDGDPAQQTDTTGMEMGYGTIVGLGTNERIQFSPPGRPNQSFDPFVMSVLRQIGIALELPFELLVKHFTASYSAARAALEEAWDYFQRRRHWLEVSLCRPVYESVLAEAVATGRLQAPGFFADPLLRRAWLGATWIGDAPSQLDPVKEVEAAKGRIEARISTREEERARLLGSAWEPIVPQIIKEERLLAGLPQPASPPVSKPADDEDQTA